ncbi:MAG TPA: lipocalin-like domain-containing protein [Steroidobacteraceae bacterium]|nr:lipocalin-like domain-containing protein [Steroidobacteraceae bacterium]
MRTSNRPREARLTRRRLVGAWRLVRIEYRGPRGPAADPFYRPGSTGLLIYDRSGWMSVQIAAPRRRSWAVEEGRALVGADTPRRPRAKAEAFDAYYAYFGTWEIDGSRSEVTHHVATALIPAEDGIDYAQRVTFERGRMIFTNRDGARGARAVRRKVWARIDRGAR